LASASEFVFAFTATASEFVVAFVVATTPTPPFFFLSKCKSLSARKQLSELVGAGAAADGC
jgi:hypothetical protein